MFKDVENRAKSALLAEEVKAQGWLRANRSWLMAIAVALLTGFIVGHW